VASSPFAVISPEVSLASGRARPRAVAAWLLACCALVFAMIVVGGVTRLTHSGLSITEWQPIVGTIPPLSDADWQAAFAKYKATPEYELVNQGMSLAEFKGIFWWEYAHRLLGRVIGAAFLVPFLWLALRGAIPKGYGGKLAGIFVLGGLQGALGWYMVQSGLVDDPRVSQFRLTAHLALAFAILGAMQWIAMSLLAGAPARRRDAPRKLAYAVVAIVCLMIVTGGFVAGIRAGFAYNTFPLMNGHVVPPEVTLLTPVWKNFFYNMATVQLDHRVVAYLLAIVVPILWWRVRRIPGMPARARTGAHLLLGMLAVQIVLGILTLLHVVPLPLAALHQAGAVLVFALSLNLAHALRRPAGVL
jgi:cytochrome c oxidase assembly protein subunit 15